MNSAQVTETIATDVKVGMVRQWNHDKTSTVTDIKAEGRAFLRIYYRSNQARPDGQFNTVSQRVRKDSYVPVVAA